MCEHQRIGQIITAELPFKGLKALLVSLYIERHGKDDDFSKLKDLMLRAGRAEEKRNQITHSIWGAGDGESISRIKTTAKEKHGIKFNFESMKVEDLDSIASEIMVLAKDIQNFNFYLLENGKAINDPLQKAWP